MSAISLAGWGLVGLVLGAALNLIATKTALLHGPTERLAPYAVLEIITGALFVGLAWRFGWVPSLFAYSWLAAIGVLLSAIDWKTEQLPSRLIWAGGIVLAVLFGVAAVADHDTWPLIRAAFGAAAVLAFYGTLYLLRPGQLGGGDLRLGGLLGLALGWAGWPAVLEGTLAGWVAAAVALPVLRLVQRPGGDRYIRLGPFLIFGAFAAVLAGSFV